MRFVFRCSSNTGYFVLKDGKGAEPTLFHVPLFKNNFRSFPQLFKKKKSLKGFPWKSHNKKSYDTLTQREENVQFQSKFQFLFSKKLYFYIAKSD